MSARISTGTELRPFSLNGAAPAASPWLEEEHASALAALRKEGCYVFRERLCEEKCEALLRLAETNPARLIPERRDLAPRMEFEPRHLQAPRYQFDEGLLVESRLVQELIANTSFLHLAQDLLEAAPINDLVAMWWSGRFSPEPSPEASQFFHYDMDRIRSIKFFVYLTDVTPENGPHVYIKGTHLAKPPTCLRARRLTDREVEILADRMVEITGPRGTIIAVDPAGLHKGKVVEDGVRLVFQLEYTNSLFGAPYARLELPEDVHPAFLQTMEERPEVFDRFTLAPDRRGKPGSKGFEPMDAVASQASLISERETVPND